MKPTQGRPVPGYPRCIRCGVKYLFQRHTHWAGGFREGAVYWRVRCPVCGRQRGYYPRARRAINDAHLARRAELEQIEQRRRELVAQGFGA